MKTNTTRACLLVWLLSISARAAPPDLQSGSVGHWQFNNCDGKVVKDLSPRGNDGAIEFGELRKEKAATSLDLDGLGARVVIRETTPFGPTNAITTSIWVRPANLRNHAVIFGIPHETDSWTTPMFGMYVSEKHVVFGLWGERGTTKVLVESPADLPVNTWTHLAGTYDGHIARLYVNGSPAAELPHTGPIARNGLPLIIGSGVGTSKPSFKGRIGELRLWDRALSAEEIAAHFRQTEPGYDRTPPPVARFNDGTVNVESPGSRAENRAWRKYPTRLLELLDRFKPPDQPIPLDNYGGRTDTPREKATGFFYTKKIDGRWWLIDPEGCRYFNVAINAFREPKDARKNFGSTERWAESAIATLRDAGFNGLGNWQSATLSGVKHPLPWVLRKDFMFNFARQKKLTVPAAGTTGFINSCMPVFHPDFEPFCEQFARDLADTSKDPYLLGIMTDNELQCPGNLLDRYLALDVSNPDLKPSRDAAAAWLAARKGPNADTKQINQHDRYEFIAFAFERYYQIVTKAIRKYDPNHLYLGSRINYHAGEFDNPWFWKMLARYHDVVSVNYYNQWGPDPSQFADWAAWADRPILLTEWYAKAADAPGLANKLGAGWLVRTQEDRGRFYQHFAMGALETPNIVGFHWFKYLDDPAESTALDSAGGANKGMFNIHGQAYQPLLNRAAAVNRQLYPLIDFFAARRQAAH